MISRDPNDRLDQLEGVRGKPRLQDYCTDTGNANIYIIEPEPPYSTDQIIPGTRFRFEALRTNTGASVVRIHGTSYTIQKDGAAVSANDILAGNIVTLEYDGSVFQLVSNAGSALHASDIGTTVQAWDANLDQLAALAVTDGNFAVGNGTAWVAESGATARTSLGVGTGDSPEFTAVNIGHASDTTIAKVSSGIISVEGVNLMRGSSGSTDNLMLRADGTGGNLMQAGVGITNNDDGSVVNTLQPAFLAFNSVADGNQTGNGALATVDFDTEIFDQGGDFASDTFTAPVGGRYALSATVQLTISSAVADLTQILLVTSNRTYRGMIIADTNDIDSGLSLHIHAIADMDAADTATVQVQVTGMAGDTAAIEGDGTTLVTYFSGHLVA